MPVNFTFLLVADGSNGATASQSSSKSSRTSHPRILPLGDLVGPRNQEQNELLSGFNTAGLVNLQKTWYNRLSGCHLNERGWHYTPGTRN